MARSDRLLRLLHALRVLPAPVTAARLAEETGVSLRSLYRDVDSLGAAGACIDGERGYGYRLTEDPALPPQTFTRLELEALLLGLAEVRHRGDPDLARAAEAVGAKVVATLPERLAREAAHAALHAYPHRPAGHAAGPHIGTLREAIWEERAVDLSYRDQAGRVTGRRVWPLLVAHSESTLTVLAWCTLREDFRMFRLDRMDAAEPTAESFRPRRAALLREYMARLQDRERPGHGTVGGR